MSAHYEEEAQVEQLRRWWRENWQALAAGLVLGLGGIFGWEAWQSHQTRAAERASAIYEDLKKADAGQGAELGKRLTGEYAGTPYAAQGQLLLAQQAAERGDWAAAQQSLEWVRDHSVDDGLRKIAKLRLARVLWQQQQAAAALQQLEIDDEDAFAPLYLELRGDIQLVQGERPAARATYEKALKLNPAPASRESLQRKLDDLSDVAS